MYLAILFTVRLLDGFYFTIIIIAMTISVEVVLYTL